AFAGPGPGRVRRGLASLGLARGNALRGVGLTAALALAVCLFQLFNSRYAESIAALLASARALVVLPLAFAFLLVTAALTEEVFFRGYLQTRLERLTGSPIVGLLAASVLFGVYHLPYAYLNPRWPSHGDWSEALSASLGQGVPGGLILGGLFLYSRRNLVAPILLHAAIDLLPASTMIKISAG
ncbi:MAG TPA: CPBP family intramembrane glutamic endopeptidase, partial [Longimicrobiales bacterium]|nr:CPBP family intramembrane glutamic endopeptidase [Longimicrobiales bacterium]